MKVKSKFFLFVFALIFIACEKGGGVLGGNGPVAVGHLVTITLEIKHHSRNMPNCKIGVKKNTLSFPSKDFSDYDEIGYSNSNGFLQLHNNLYGDYYFYVEGYDDAIADSIYGYLSLSVDSSTIEKIGNDYSQYAIVYVTE